VTGRSPRYSLDRKQRLAEESTEMEGNEHPCFM